MSYDWEQHNGTAGFSRDSYTPYGGLVNRKGVCLGYATTFQLLMEMAGVECITITGTALEKMDHAWNQVQLDGAWYCADPTWDVTWGQPAESDGLPDGKIWQFFNTTSDYMARTGHQWDYDRIPEATSDTHGVPGAG